MIYDEDPLRRRPRESTARRLRHERCVWMARETTKWPSTRWPITKIISSDGCNGNRVPLEMGPWYDFREFGCHLGNVGLFSRRPNKAGAKTGLHGHNALKLTGWPVGNRLLITGTDRRIGTMIAKPKPKAPVKPSRHQPSKAELNEPIHLPGRSPEFVARTVMQGGARRREPDATKK